MEVVFELHQTNKFKSYLNALKDGAGKAAILARLKRLENGNWGDAEPIGDGLTELRIHKGPGYRVYCKLIGRSVVVILGASTKNRQQADIDSAKEDAKAL